MKKPELDHYKYRRNNRLVLEKVLEGDVAHERRVMDALGSLLSQQDDHYLGLERAKLGIADAELDFTPRQCLILELALALHDIGQRLNNEPHAESGYMLLKGNRALPAAVEQHLEQCPGPHRKGLTPEELGLVLWLVRHHDVLGNVYTGERLVRYLNDILVDLKMPEGTIQDGKRLLFIVAIADFVGRSPGRLTPKRVSFWREWWLVANDQARNGFPDFGHRMEQWTWSGARGIALDSPHHKKETKGLRKALADEKTRNVFSHRIGLITYGLYILQRLEVCYKAILLKRVADTCVSNFREGVEVALKFRTIYSLRLGPPAHACLYDAYVDAIGNCVDGIVSAFPEKNEIAIELPSETVPEEVAGILTREKAAPQEVTVYLRRIAVGTNYVGTLKAPEGWTSLQGDTLHFKAVDGRKMDIAIDSCDNKGIARFTCHP